MQREADKRTRGRGHGFLGRACRHLCGERADNRINAGARSRHVPDMGAADRRRAAVLKKILTMKFFITIIIS